ncbi:hypothetical protein [Frankia sp. Cppng1_Ct_nod]|uniref:hypothetical protein n=1 Tax=Frankia sp. Cppng1_Ct_nod TaxID=2897162 RepID=UPI0010412E4A|nr:hypothetical protein [Frankia sp. Cppng1_Ct_nod]
MGIPLHERILDSIEAYFALSPQMLALSLDAVQPETGRPATRLSLTAAREFAMDPTAPATAGDAIWSQLVRLASEKKEPWDLAVIWMMAPGLRRICRRCRRYNPAMDPGELESEAVAGLVEALQSAEPEREGLGSWLWWTTYRHVQRACSHARRETPTADIELVGNLKTHEYDESRSTAPTLRLVDSVVPVAEELDTVGRASLEGERLGALAHRLGLDQTLSTSDLPAGKAA